MQQISYFNNTTGQYEMTTGQSGAIDVRVVSGGGGGGGGGASVPPVLAVIDSATPAKRWVMVTDYSATPATVMFYEFGTTTLGTPTLPIMPDADTSVAVSNFPATQAVSGSVSVSNFPATQAVTGPLTDAQLRAAAVPVSGPLTDAQLRATAVPVSGTFWQATQPVSAASLPLPSGAATETTLSALNTKVPSQNVPGLMPVDTLGTPGTARNQTTSGTAANIVLTTTCRRVSMTATAATFYSISGTATSSSHYIGANERLDFDVPASTTISVLQVSSAGTVYVTELT